MDTGSLRSSSALSALRSTSSSCQPFISPRIGEDSSLSGYTATYDAWHRLVKLYVGSTTIARYECDATRAAWSIRIMLQPPVIGKAAVQHRLSGVEMLSYPKGFTT